MILVIDNYDSFTYNLVQYLGELGRAVEVCRNDGIDVAGIRARRPEGILLSPGPCTPNQAGISLDAVASLAGSLPILGVCLGHQCIGQAFGGRIGRARRVMHGKISAIHHDGRGVFQDIGSPFMATRYHSLIIDSDRLPDCLEVSAWTQREDGSADEIMGVRHRQLAVHGVQFHPESILSEHGHKLLENFLNLT